eukprot:14135-Heterococcus_DN1.PRE.2
MAVGKITSGSGRGSMPRYATHYTVATNRELKATTTGHSCTWHPCVPSSSCNAAHGADSTKRRAGTTGLQDRAITTFETATLKRSSAGARDELKALQIDQSSLQHQIASPGKCQRLCDKRSVR